MSRAKRARALGCLDDRGTLEPGKWCDLAIWDIERPAELVYRMGFNPLHAASGGADDRAGHRVAGSLGAWREDLKNASRRVGHARLRRRPRDREGIQPKSGFGYFGQRGEIIYGINTGFGKARPSVRIKEKRPISRHCSGTSFSRMLQAWGRRCRSPSPA